MAPKHQTQLADDRSISSEPISNASTNVAHHTRHIEHRRPEGYTPPQKPRKRHIESFFSTQASTPLATIPTASQNSPPTPQIQVEEASDQDSDKQEGVDLENFEDGDRQNSGPIFDRHFSPITQPSAASTRSTTPSRRK